LQGVGLNEMTTQDKPAGSQFVFAGGEGGMQQLIVKKVWVEQPMLLQSPIILRLTHNSGLHGEEE